MNFNFFQCSSAKSSACVLQKTEMVGPLNSVRSLKNRFRPVQAINTDCKGNDSGAIVKVQFRQIMRLHWYASQYKDGHSQDECAY